jgi:PTS system cellobiose-specific IIB component
MKKILLVCSAGMSTSLLVTKMQEAAKEQGVEAEIWAVGEAEASSNWEKADVLLLGPQVRFLEGKIKDMVGGKIPVDVIDMRAYGTMDGKTVLKQALDLIDNK